jgi:pyruvate dehydrogenase E1 component beta subunit
MNSGGVKVVFPSTAHDAKGLLKAAIRDPNPVVFLYHNLMGSETDDVPDGDYVVPLGRCRVRRSGSDVTVVASGLMAKRAVAAAEMLEVEGISAEVIDPRTLYPLDIDGIIDSVMRTGRLIAVDEARRTCSAASEIVARVSQYAWEHLVAPPQVLAVEDVPIPFAPILEREVVPSAEQIVSAAKQILGGERRP